MTWRATLAYDRKLTWGGEMSVEELCAVVLFASLMACLLLLRSGDADEG